jgi:hypothetical protein
MDAGILVQLTPRLSLVRAPTSPDPHTDQGEHDFTFAILPHRHHFTGSDVAKETLAFCNEPYGKSPPLDSVNQALRSEDPEMSLTAFQSWTKPYLPFLSSRSTDLNHPASFWRRSSVARKTPTRGIRLSFYGCTKPWVAKRGDRSTCEFCPRRSTCPRQFGSKV